jgi:hypothetical protein
MMHPVPLKQQLQSEQHIKSIMSKESQIQTYCDR